MMETETQKLDLWLIIYWIATALIVVSQLASGVLDWVGFEPIVAGITELGYPLYLLYILGTCKILGAIVIAMPGMQRLKEWAYAGFTFDFLGAFSSHALNGDGPERLAPPLVVLAILLTSYFLRPSNRKL